MRTCQRGSMCLDPSQHTNDLCIFVDCMLHVDVFMIKAGPSYTLPNRAHTVHATCKWFGFERPGIMRAYGFELRLLESCSGEQKRRFAPGLSLLRPLRLRPALGWRLASSMRIMYPVGNAARWHARSSQSKCNGRFEYPDFR